MNEESQVRGFYNITFIYTNQETVPVLEKNSAVPRKQTKHLEHESKRKD